METSKAKLGFIILYLHSQVLANLKHLKSATQLLQFHPCMHVRCKKFCQNSDHVRARKQILWVTCETYAPINALPLLRRQWDNDGVLTQSNIKCAMVGQTQRVKSRVSPRRCGFETGKKFMRFFFQIPHSGATLFVKCPMVGRNFRVKSPTIAPLKPKGGGWWDNILIGALFLS